MESPWVELAPRALAERMGAGEMLIVVDVRTAPEVVAYHIPGVRWIPLNELADRFREIEPEGEVVLVCEHGVRSAMACQFLHDQGFKRLANLMGGMSEWTGPVERGLPENGNI
jgi:rhodanese-related sulfurtransferase